MGLTLWPEAFLLFTSFAGVYALKANPAGALHRRFALFMLSLSLYFFLELITLEVQPVLLFQKLDYLCLLFVSAAFAHMCYAFPLDRPSAFSRCFFLVVLFWSPAFGSDELVREVWVGEGSKVIIKGPFFSLFHLSFVALFCLGVARLGYAMLQAQKQRERAQILYIGLGVLLGGVFGFYGTLLFPRLKEITPWLPPFSVMLVSLFCAYALLRTHPLDIRVFVRKTLFYYLLVGGTVGAYVLGVKTLGTFLGELAGADSFYAESAMIVVLAFIFKPVADSLERWINRRVFPSRDVEEVLARLAQLGEDEAAMLTACAEELKRFFEGEAGAIFVEKEGSPSRLYGEPPVGWCEPARPRRLLQGWFSPRSCLWLSASLKGMRDQLGWIVVGPRRQGMAYSDEDQSRLHRLGVQIGTQIENLAMRQAVAAKVRELAQKERLAEIGELAAGLAHEIKNPLGHIRGSAQLLAQLYDGEGQAGSNNGEEIGKFVSYVEQEAKRVQELLHHFLLYARYDEEETCDVSLHQVVEDVLARYRPSAEAQGIEVTTRLEEGGVIQASLSRIRMAVENLVRNAIEAMPGGGRLSVTLLGDARQAVLTVSDTGAGVAEEDREKIFRPFFTTKQGGTGLGLAIVRRVAEHYGGRVSVASTPGRETRFTLVFPRRPAPPAPAAEKSRSPQAADHP